VFDPEKELMTTVFADALRELEANPGDPSPWTRIDEAFGDARASEPDAAAAIDARDAAALAQLLEEWRSGKRLSPERDRLVLKRALKAFRKSLKVTRLDDESKIGGNPMTTGKSSGVVGIVPPARYPRAVWDELVRQKRLFGERGVYELPPE
jgi:hypothetical protein